MVQSLECRVFSHRKMSVSGIMQDVLEIARCDEQHHDENLLPTLHKLQDLPQIRSIVILSDCLTEEFGIIDRGAPHLLMTVAKFAQNRDFAFNRGLSL